MAQILGFGDINYWSVLFTIKQASCHWVFIFRKAFETYCVNEAETDSSDANSVDTDETESDKEHETEDSTLFEAVSMLNIQ